MDAAMVDPKSQQLKTNFVHDLSSRNHKDLSIENEALELNPNLKKIYLDRLDNQVALCDELVTECTINSSQFKSHNFMDNNNNTAGDFLRSPDKVNDEYDEEQLTVITKNDSSMTPN